MRRTNLIDGVKDVFTVFILFTFCLAFSLALALGCVGLIIVVFY